MGDLSEIKKGMFHFKNEAYRIEGVGSFFFMDMKGMFGLMKMQTAVITPQYKDLSFCNIDAIHAMGNDTMMFEMYRSYIQETDLSVFKSLKVKYADLENYKTDPRWYDSWKLEGTIAKKGKKCAARHQEMMKEFLQAYLELLKQAPGCDYAQKQEKNSGYVEELIAHGGAAVDNLRKMIGKEKTDLLIRKYMFNTVN
jgi:hypothetical protein